MKLQFIKHKIIESRLHIAERAIEPNLPEWRKMPFCRNGGLDLHQWDFIEIETTSLNEDNVCGSCIRRLNARKISFPWKDNLIN